MSNAYCKMEQIKKITHSATGATCEIHDFGATVISFKTGAGRECLFLSRDTKKDGSKAIRGGIPLVFPQFGQPDKSMPQHGFLRNNFWKVDESTAYDTADAAGVSYLLTLGDVKNSRGGKWDENTKYNCTCVYSIKIEGSKMTTTLEIKNIGDKPFEFQTLQHTYLMVDEKAAQDASRCYVTGLEGYSVSDKISNQEYSSGADPVTIPDNVDRVYDPSSTGDAVDVIVGVGAGKTLKLTATGSLDGASTPVSCVVWNPFKEKAAAMSDFGDDQYVDMICVEPGLLSGSTLPAGKSACLTQVMEMM